MAGTGKPGEVEDNQRTSRNESGELHVGLMMVEKETGKVGRMGR
jgi:hypothetical protein